MKIQLTFILSAVILFTQLLTHADETASKMDTMDSATTCDDTCEIMEADRAFNARAQEIGVPAAFLEFAADDAVMYRNGMEPVIGKIAIAEVMKGEENVSLVWKPLTCDIAKSRDLGYSRGSFILNMPAAGEGQPDQGPIEGYYVSIWKKQQDGSWKWVMDTGIISEMPKS